MLKKIPVAVCALRVALSRQLGFGESETREAGRDPAESVRKMAEWCKGHNLAGSLFQIGQPRQRVVARIAAHFR